MNTIVLASNNQGKLNELSFILKPLGVKLVSQKALNVPPYEETGLTFVENAIGKARHASKHTHLPAIGDDSGLCVKALAGRPGLYSSRFAGDNATDQQNIEKLLSEMEGTKHRQAYFHATIVLLLSETDPDPIIAQGQLSGEITEAIHGVGGFGYDPIFYLPKTKCTLADLSREKKNAISHRAIACSSLLSQLSEQSHCK